MADDFLTASDRCDAGECSARALFRAQLSEGYLLFCRHHARKHKAALLKQGATLDEQSNNVAQSTNAYR